VSLPGRPQGEQAPERGSPVRPADSQGRPVITLPRVSVIVRSMARPSLGHALAAIAAQTHPAMEVVIVAASGPAHPRPAATCGAFPVRFVASDVALDRPRAANAGLAAAGGDWITFLDDDDGIEPGHVAGLVAAAADADPGAGVVHSLSRAVLRDGTKRTLGRPVALVQLFERSFIHLSAALVDRRLVVAGCRFDPAFAILEDWDFFLALAQHTRFHFVPQATFVWHADAGDSGAGGGANQDDARFAQYRDRIYAKWRPQREALAARVEPLLAAAVTAAQAGRLAEAQSRAQDVLAVSQNDPWALNLLAMVARARGDLAAARRLQSLAVDVRPGDADLVYNLALLCRDAGDPTAARAHAMHAATLAPQDPKHRRLAAEIDSLLSRPA